MGDHHAPSRNRPCHAGISPLDAGQLYSRSVLRSRRVGPGGGSRAFAVGDRYPAASRALWSFLGQTVSSGSNFALSVLVLSVASAAEFAVFALCLTTYLFTLQLIRAVIGVPVTLLHTDFVANPSSHDPRQEQRAAIGAAVAVGILAGSITLFGAVFASQGRVQLIVVGLSLPFLLWQDTVRYVCFARGRPSAAAGADSLWVVLQLVGSATAFAVDQASAATLLGVWAGSGVVSGSVVGIRLGLLPRLPAGLRWAGQHRSLCQRLLTEFMVAAGSHYSVYYGLALLSGADQLGRLKAAQTMLGPVTVLLLSGGVLGIPESVRAAHDPPLLRRIAMRLSLALAAAALAWGAITYLVLPVIGPSFFPDAWATTRPLIPMLTLFSLALGASTGATSALRALGDSPWLLRVRAYSGVLLVMLGAAASARSQANGALFALTAAEGAVVALAWRRLWRFTTRSPTTLGPDGGRQRHATDPGRPLSRPDEEGPDSLWP